MFWRKKKKSTYSLSQYEKDNIVTYLNGKDDDLGRYKLLSDSLLAGFYNYEKNDRKILDNYIRDIISGVSNKKVKNKILDIYNKHMTIIVNEFGYFDYNHYSNEVMRNIGAINHYVDLEVYIYKINKKYYESLEHNSPKGLYISSFYNKYYRERIGNRDKCFFKRDKWNNKTEIFLTGDISSFYKLAIDFIYHRDMRIRREKEEEQRKRDAKEKQQQDKIYGAKMEIERILGEIEHVKEDIRFLDNGNEETEFSLELIKNDIPFIENELIKINKIENHQEIFNQCNLLISYIDNSLKKY